MCSRSSSSNTAMQLVGLLVLLAPAVFGAICPQEKHTVCNDDSDFACTCAAAQAEESPVPQVSCSNFVARDLQSGNFPVVSVQFTLDDSVEGLDEWPEEAFRDAISSSLRIEENDVIILRASCMGTDDTLTVQFGILKKETNTSNIPFQEEDFIDAESIATRMKAMGHLSQIADLDVDNIEYTEDLLPVEYEPDNSELVFKAVGLAVTFGIFFIMGLIATCRQKNEDDYTDDLQKA
ncbi:unnamed protein product [Caenorhabditis auriculariae]|uniref:Uncharacterized protein n=1 Tax=Caenorhabditis auriculariae TaxID=2777116 RepID=A0A8S1GQ21_9PELO|nr:unnamed protein product [Caenorhabditis auriculariae]